MWKKRKTTYSCPFQIDFLYLKPDQKIIISNLEKLPYYIYFFDAKYKKATHSFNIYRLWFRCFVSRDVDLERRLLFLRGETDRSRLDRLCLRSFGERDRE